MTTGTNKREQQAREIAEILLSGSAEHQTQPLSRYHSINGMHVNLHNSLANNSDYLHEAVIAGCTRDGRMSAVRRFFCLFVTFDLLFTTLLWIICFVITGDNVWNEIVQQIAKYSIHTSLFDIVMASSARFIILLLFYAFLSINHWSVIALTTAGSSAFLMTKVFLYKWSSTSNYTLEVLLVISSFIISWGQAWFLDFRVLPQESQARDFLRAIVDDEQQPLLSNARASVQSSVEHCANFYSPIESPQESDEEVEPNATSITREDEEYCQKAEEAFHEAWKTLNAEDWKLEKRTNEGDLVHTKWLRRTHKIFKITGTVDIPPKLLYDEFRNNIEHVPKWNPTLTECRTLRVINDKTSISYQVAAEGGGGIVSSRDFVNLRYCDICEGNYVCSGVSIPFPDMPPQKGHVRGENGPGCWVMRPIPNEPNKCVFQWLLDTNLKGWIPQSIIDTALSFAMIEYIGHIRTYGSKLHSEGKF